MKLNGVLGDCDPGGIPGILPQSTTPISWPLKCSPRLWATWFQFPPPADFGLHPGYTTPPKLCSGLPLALIVPPPVSQQAPVVGGAFVGQTVLLIRKLPANVS